MGDNTHIFDRWKGYTLDDCRCEFCIHFAGINKPCPLEGYPDGWTAFGHDGKEISDTRRYQMLGNSVAVPCVAYILLGIAKQFRKEV